MKADFQVDISGAVKKLGGVSGAMRKEMRKGFRLIGADWERHVKDSIRPGGKGNQGGSDLHNRTGALRRSVKFQLMKAPSLGVNLIVGGKGAPHARLQEEGGTVKPRRGKYLTIPLDNAKTASGALSGRYKIRRGGIRKTRSGKTRVVFKTDKGETFIYKSKKGNLLIAIKRTGRKKINLKRDTLYVLKKSVRVRARLGAWDAIRLDGPRGNAVRRRLNLAVKRAVETA
jgi:hypothetical protein